MKVRIALSYVSDLDDTKLSFSDRDDFDEPVVEENSPEPAKATETVSVEPEIPEEPPETSAITEVPADTGQIIEKKLEDPPANSEIQPLGTRNESAPHHNNQSMPPRQFRQKFQRWPNQGNRWPNQFQRMSMMQGGPPIRQMQMRPGFSPQQRSPFNNFNSFMPGRPPIPRQRYFYPNSGPMGGGDPRVPGLPSYVPSPIMGGSGPAMPRKVLINPNFKGGVEAAKSE